MVGLKIRSERKNRRVTQKELAEAIDVPISELRKWERGESLVEASKIIPAARALGIPPARLFDLPTSQG